MALTAQALVQKTWSEDQTEAIALTDDLEVTVEENITVTCSGAISGDYKLIKKGAGKLKLSAANSFKALDIVAGNLEAAAAGSLGEGLITITGGAGTLRITEYLSKPTFNNNITVTGKSTGACPAIFLERRTNVATFTGDITADNNLCIGNLYWSSSDNKVSYKNSTYAKFTGAVTVKSPASLRLSTAFDTAFTGKIDADAIYTESESTGTYFGHYPSNPTAPSARAMVLLGNSNNRIGLLSIGGYESFKATAENAFGGAKLYSSASSEKNRHQFFAESYNQTVANLSSATCATKNLGLTAMQLRGTETITITGGVDTATCYLRIPGASLVIDDKSETGNFVQEFVNRPSETAGTLTMKRGTMKVSGIGTFSNVTAIAVESAGGFIMASTAPQPIKNLQTLSIAGKFEVSGTAAFASTIFDDDCVDLALTTGSTITVPEGTAWKVRSLKINGDPKSVKAWTHADNAVIPENLTITPKFMICEPENITWTGNGGSDTAITSAANWDGKTEPLDFTQDRYHVTFANGGSQATMSSSALFKSLTFTGDSFTLSGTSKDALVHLQGPLTFADGISDGSVFTIDAPIVLDEYNSYNWLAPAGVTLAVTSGLTTVQSLALGGEGTFYLGGTNVIDGTLRMTNCVAYLSGVLKSADDGNDGSALILKYGGNTAANPYSCIFSGVEIKKPVSLTGKVTGEYSMRVLANTTNVVCGKLTKGSPADYWQVDGDLELAGGISSSWSTYKYGNGKVIISRTSGTFSGSDKGSSRFFVRAGELALNVASNNFSTTQRLRLENTSICSCGVPHVFSSNVDFFELYNTVTFDMGRYDQRIGNVMGTMSTATLTGEYPAKLEISRGVIEASKALTNLYCNVTGGAGLKMTGPDGNVLLVTNRTSGVLAMTSCGDLEAVSGTLELAANATWLNGTNFTAKGTGTLKFAAANQVNGEIAALHLAGSGKVEIPENVTLKVASAETNGVELAVGTYTATELGSFISGEGAIRVGSVGTTFIIK